MADTSQTTKPVGAIPTAALNQITDQNTRAVLQTLVDGWNVRNGNSGTGDHQFVTRADLGLSSAAGNFVVGSNNQAPSVQTDYSDPTVAQVNRIIADVQSQVINSELFQALGARVSLIDKPAGILDQLGNLSTGIYQETQDRSTADSAVLNTVNTQVANLNGSIAGVQQKVDTLASDSTAQAHTLTTLQAGINQNTAAVSNETTARVNADNAIVNTVNTQYTAVNQSLALVQQRVDTVSNSYASQASTLSQVQASIGSNATAVAQETTARVSADNTLFGQWTVKIDQNGYVSGFGLASTASNSAPASMFVVRADSFAVGSPSGPGIPARAPFVVYTTPWNFGGETIQPGVYMQSAMIANGTIGTAQIGVATIDTLRLGGNVVTVPAFFNGFSGPGASGLGPGSLTGQIGAVTLQFPDTVNIVAVVSWQASVPGVSTNARVQIRADGQTFLDISNSCQQGFTSAFTASGHTVLGGGPHTFTFHVGNDWSSGSWNLWNWSVLILGVMR